MYDCCAFEIRMVCSCHTSMKCRKPLLGCEIERCWKQATRHRKAGRVLRRARGGQHAVRVHSSCVSQDSRVPSQEPGRDANLGVGTHGSHEGAAPLGPRGQAGAQGSRGEDRGGGAGRGASVRGAARRAVVRRGHAQTHASRRGRSWGRRRIGGRCFLRRTVQWFWSLSRPPRPSCVH